MTIVLFLDADWQPLRVAPWTRAITDLFLGKVEVITYSRDRTIKCVSRELPMPAVVRVQHPGAPGIVRDQHVGTQLPDAARDAQPHVAGVLHLPVDLLQKGDAGDAEFLRRAALLGLAAPHEVGGMDRAVLTALALPHGQRAPRQVEILQAQLLDFAQAHGALPQQVKRGARE